MKVSLGVVLIVIIVVVAVISGILALVPLLEASKSSSFDIAQDFSVTISERISDRVQSIFEDLQFSVDTMQRAANYSAVSVGDAGSVLRWMGPIMSATTAEEAFYCLDNGTTIRFFPPATSDTSIITLQVIDHTANTTINATYNVTSTSLTYDSSSVTHASFNCSLQPYYRRVRANRIWTDPFVLPSDPTNPRLIAGAPLFDPTGGLHEVGAFGLNFNSRYLINYLESSDIATTGVAVVMDLRNYSVLAYHMGFQIPSASIADPTALNGLRPYKPWELPSSQVAESLAGVGSSLSTCSTPCGFRIGSSYLNTLFVRVDEPYNAYNMDLRLLLVIPSGDFLSGIQTSIVIGSLAAVGAIIVLAILSAVLLFSCLQPLHRLEQRLYSIAVLREDTSSTPMSFLREIYNIEVAYAGMQAELMKMKSFLPQSVLRQLEEELAEEEDNPTSDSSNSKEDEEEDVPTGGPGILPGATQGGPAERNPLAVDFEQEEMDMLIQQQQPTEGAAKHDPSHHVMTKGGSNADVATAVLGRAAAAHHNNNEKEQAPAATAFGGDQQALELLERPTGAHADGPALALKLPMDSGRGLEAGLQAVNPLQVLNTTDRAQRGGGDSPDNESLAPGQSMCTAYVNFAISENRKKRTARATLRSLNDLCVLSAKRVTVAMANVIGFHQVMEAQGAAGIEKFHAILLDTVLQEVNGTSGVLDFVHGDRFLITYNASTTCLPHSICAAEMVIRVCSKLHHVGLQGYQGIRFGVSAGEALCGNFGNELMKRFSAVGPVVHQAFTLMQQTKAEETSGCGASLVCSSVYTRIKARYLAEHMNYVQLPGQTNAALISTIRGVRPSAEPFDAIMERTRVTSRRRPTVGKANRGRSISGSPALKDLPQAPQKDGLSLSPEDPESAEVQEVLEEAAALVDKINAAFETFASGDVEAAKVLAQEIPESRCAALQKAFLVCE